MVPDILLNNQRPAEYILEKQVKESLEKIKEEDNTEDLAVK